MLIISTSFGLEPQIASDWKHPVLCQSPVSDRFDIISNIFHKQTAPKIEILIEFHKQIKGKKNVPSHSILIHSGHVQALQKVIPAMIRRVSSVVSNIKKTLRSLQHDRQELQPRYRVLGLHEQHLLEDC